MSFDIDELFTNQDLETEGVWVDFYADSKIKIASTDSKAYKSELANLARKHKLQLDTDNEDYFDLIDDLTCEALAKHVVKDWKGINLGNEKDVPYSPSVGKKVLLKSSKFRAFVEEAASDHKTFKDAVVETVKNS